MSPRYAARCWPARPTIRPRGPVGPAGGGSVRPVDPVAAPAEELDEASLRPRTLDEFVGQAQLTEHLRIVLEAARKRRQPVDHLLFAGPPGLGKTSLAGIVASEMGVGLRITAGPVLVRTGDLAALLTDLQEGDVLFIDEIHRLHRAVEEVLYPAMEDFKLDILIGKGPDGPSIRLDLPRFTPIGATTRTGLVTSPLRDRFGFVGRLDHYTTEELEAIVGRSAEILGVPIEPEGAQRIAQRSRGHRGSPTGSSPGPGLRRGASRREDHRRGARGRPEPVRGGRAGPGQGRPLHSGRAVPPLRRSGRGPHHAGPVHRRGTQHHRGRLRAVPVATGTVATDACRGRIAAHRRSRAHLRPGARPSRPRRATPG